ncbi:hypothetical protein [Desulfosediminicola flagellatus]|uniref:hypothetical protein n=1 Tax=Desulfosediminicola flagellatus TaxID=2569541 RepID=UPI0010AC6548|nr:hypothetical protein [Desulfosediminicola flagellatus]
MVIYLEKELFKDSNRDDLLLILHLGIKNQTFIQFDDDDEDVKNWQENNNPEGWDEVFRCWISDATKFQQMNKAIVREELLESDWLSGEFPIITLTDAYYLIIKSFELWLENERNDGSFIRCVIDDDVRDRFDQLRSRGRLKLNGLGGIGEMKAVLRLEPKEFGFRNKIFVICDSDAANPSIRDENAEEIVAICNDNKIWHHCLERRAIENYVPINYLADKMNPLQRTNSDLGKKYDAFLSLNINQKNHFHMKNGFKNLGCLNSGLYDSLADDVKTLLEGGFGDKLSEVFSDEDPEIIHNHIHGDGDPELNSIFTKINHFMRVPV